MMASDAPLRLFDISLKLAGARQVLINLHDSGRLRLDGTERGVTAYDEVAYRLLMQDDALLLQWLAAPGGMQWRYGEFVKDAKGRLLKCVAKPLYN